MADKEAGILVVDVLAAKPLSTIQKITYNFKKNQSLFPDKASRVSRHQFMQTLTSEYIIRVHLASDEGAAAFQV